VDALESWAFSLLHRVLARRRKGRKGAVKARGGAGIDVSPARVRWSAFGSGFHWRELQRQERRVSDASAFAFEVGESKLA
jgi:hypothetical protein